METFHYILLQWMLAWNSIYSRPSFQFPSKLDGCCFSDDTRCLGTCDPEKDHTCPEQNVQLRCDTTIEEGDIKNPMISFGELLSMSDENRHEIWIDRVIPYQISGKFLNNEANIIHEAIDMFMASISSCIRFCDRSIETSCQNKEDYLDIVREDGCYSLVGRQGGRQVLSLAENCLLRTGTIFHELMHALGFLHEHNRSDRNEYIQVIEHNIMEGKQSNFIKREERDENGVYDFFSIMHYSLFAFAKNGNSPTLLPWKGKVKSNKIGDIGQRKNFTKEDIKKIKEKYNCHTVTCDKPPNLHNGFYSPNPLQEIPVATKVEYKCNENYILFGANVRQCRYDGQWSGQEAYCFEKGDIQSSCTFDKDGDTCDWSNEEWKQTRFPTLTEGSGPDGDETELGSSHVGQYLYLESSSPAKKGDTCILTYNMPESCDEYDNIYCVSMWYNMYGDTGMGTLNITIQGVESRKILWTLSGNQGRSWKYVTKCFKRCTCKALSIEAVRGTSYRSDIAIDDVLIAKLSTMTTYCEKMKKNNENVDCSKLYENII